MENTDGDRPIDTNDVARLGAADGSPASPHPKPKARLLLSIVLVSMLAGVIVYLWTSLDHALKCSSVRGTIPSMLTLLYRMAEHGDPTLDSLTNSVWTSLSAEQYAAVLTASADYGYPDMGQSTWEEIGVLLDPWGQRYGIATRNTEGRYEFIVWSLGQDGNIGTTDDIVYPHGETIPESLIRRDQ